MRIALDALGGDYAPDPNIDGALIALEANPDLEVDLVGDPCLLSARLSERGYSGDRKTDEREIRICADFAGRHLQGNQQQIAGGNAGRRQE